MGETAKRLNKKYNLGAVSFYYHKEGKFYENLKGFPGVLFDSNGYVRFASEDEYKNHEKISVSVKTNVKGGISSLKNYIKFPDLNNRNNTDNSHVNNFAPEPTGTANEYNATQNNQINSSGARNQDNTGDSYGEAFNPQSLEDARNWIESQVAIRQGATEFRKRLLEAYDRKCLITDYEVEEALQAAHICPYRGPSFNALENGLLLRADVHTLFDRHLFSIDPKTFTVILTPKLKGTSYEAQLSGKKIKPSKNMDLETFKFALQIHLKESTITL
ncbi:MAG: HNH endonuclease [Deltaproteobacteria bacterium]|nr:HNH endonuclease [Deltaproteobacteria bacterium]